jgi:cathepsin F
VATYGPATVCLEASLWQDYSGGIITSALGCSSAFVDMNHCVQAVGYAFVEIDDSDSNNGDKNNEDKNKQKNKNTRREGYWIIRNQWSSSWGMQGYAYVAMGANTCGVLNDMTLVYM